MSDDCKHKFIDSNQCLKCGRTLPSLSAAATGSAISKEEMQKVADEIAAEFNLPKVQKDIPCPNCYGGHFRPCQWCGDTGRVDFVPNTEPTDRKDSGSVR